MTDQVGDIFGNYRNLAQQTWDAWTRQWPPMAVPFAPAPASMPGLGAGDPFMRGGAALAGFMQWLQTLAQTQASSGTPPAFGAPAFMQAFAGLDQAGAHGFMQQWSQWMQAMQQAGFVDPRQSFAPLGYTREQQREQQALFEAMQACMQASARYQQLLQDAGTQGAARMQDLMQQLVDQGKPPATLKALYDLWVDACEGAYAEIAMSDEFRAAYGAMVNTLMEVRRLQRQQTEQLCRELGMPTRSEVDSIGKRLQETRRALAVLQQRGIAKGDAADDATTSTPSGKRSSPAGKQRAVAIDGAAAKQVVARSNLRSRPASKQVKPAGKRRVGTRK